MTQYGSIVIDPPWPYPEGFASGTKNHHINGRPPTVEERGPIVRDRPLPYEAMSLEEIRQLPVANLAAAHARLFVWTTNRYLPETFSLIRAWGFVYKQILVWDKTPNIPIFTGSVAPNAAEFLLVATRGKPPRLGKWSTSIVRSRKPRTTHSCKPEVFLDLVEATSPGPYLEMFARRNRLGWNTWGNECIEDIAL